MLIFVYGEDEFRVQEKVQQLARAFREKFDPAGLNLTEWSASDKNLEVGEVLTSVRALPFFGQKRMVIVRDLMAVIKSANTDVWVEGLKKTPDSTIVIFWESLDLKDMEKKPLFVALKDLVELYHFSFPLLQGAELNRWVQARVKEHGGFIDFTGMRALVERVGSDLWHMDNEIGKLVAYARGQSITVKMVDGLVHASFEGKIFQLIDAISKRRKADAIRLLQEERWSGSDDHYLLTMLGRQVRILLAARSLLDENPRTTKEELAKALDLHPFVAQKTLAQARGFSLEHLKSVHDLLFEFDVAMKTGRMDADLAVDLTTVKLME